MPNHHNCSLVHMCACKRLLREVFLCVLCLLQSTAWPNVLREHSIDAELADNAVIVLRQLVTGV